MLPRFYLVQVGVGGLKGERNKLFIEMNYSIGALGELERERERVEGPIFE